MRAERLRAIGQRLAQTDHDVVALQEIWFASQDWRYVQQACEANGAFGSGLAILSKHPIVEMQTHMYSLTGTPIYVQHGDWIAGKACGCATIKHPTLGLIDVWDTHFTAVGGQVGPETRRANSVVEAFELAHRCRISAERGRHVVCMGDFNSLPDSVCIAILHRYGGLYDACLDVDQTQGALLDSAITCDSPDNTWTKGKPLDELAVRHRGKRLDYVLYRGPNTAPDDWVCTRSRVVFKELIPDLEVSYSDHFGVEATLDVRPQGVQARTASRESAVEILWDALPILDHALRSAKAQQRSHYHVFWGSLNAFNFGI
ncbi:Isc1p [Malassezia vespertilionis]|uniref:Isc1p n=1 Tax=Malassezia vespertilionis TaxID=2020962 RepID=A0A2N1JET3_9BASI|nr:Isc1p [Malassezia vespertilionis]